MITRALAAARARLGGRGHRLRGAGHRGRPHLPRPCVAGPCAGQVRLRQPLRGADREQIDGTLYFSFLGYAIAGLAASYDLDLEPHLNTVGLAMIAELEQECVIESLPAHAFVRSATLTTDGQPFTEALDRAPFDTVVADQRIGVGRRPEAPALVTHSVLDDIVPYEVGRAVARRWCEQGATVRLSTNAAAGHVGGLLAAYPAAFLFLEGRFADLPAVSSCWRL